MTQSNFNFTNVKKAYEVKFYALPQILLQGERYKDLSDSAILLYSVLRDRLNYSLQNNWVDENNNVYFIFTNQELKELRHWSNDKTNKVKKELEDANLLLQKRTGFNPKTGKNEPNRLYLADLEVTATDVYIKQNKSKKNAESLGTSGNPKIGNPHESAESLGTSGNPKIGNPHESVAETSQSFGTSGNPKIGYNQDNTKPRNKNNRYNKDTSTLDFSKEKYTTEQLEQQDQDLMAHAKEYLSDPESKPSFLNEESLDLLGKWCNTSAEFNRYIGVILNARKDIEKEKNVTFFLDTDKNQQKIANTIRRFFFAIRKEDNHIRTTTENYLYGTFKNLFTEIAIDLLNDEWKNKENKNEEEFLANIERQLNNRQ
ncbi:MAG: replication initiator protein A [Staphylococcus equorum]|nr:replication initiator protein A [Staphylococcus equorum]MDN6750932.1 replication initiator protein A [Staphylococcus equorum]